MNEFEKAQSAKILGCYNTSDIEKGGEGSGRKIGTTSSGKEVYENHSASEYDNFTKDDHKEAAHIHYQEQEKYLKEKNKLNDKNEKDNIEKRELKHFAHSNQHYQYSK